MNAIDFYLHNSSVLCIIAETRGSCPGRTGFKMAVPAQGHCVGSVGGGGFEHLVINRAREMLADDVRKPVLLDFHHSDEKEPGMKSGMICSGRQKIILVPHQKVDSAAADPKGLEVTGKGIRFTEKKPEQTGLEDLSPGEWIYRETIPSPQVVYIFGGGHCSKALSVILETLDMRSVVLDDREYVHTMDSNSLAWKRIRVDYSDVASMVPDDGSAVVVIMTASHKGDQLVLEQMVEKNLKYLGMMASRATATHILSSLVEKGFPEKSILRVHTPVGIPISSHTPAEIAVSISAEIIQVLNSGN